MSTYTAHPSAECFPLIDGQRFRDLVDDIRANGLREPITLWRDAEGAEWLLDGRNRARACAEAGVSPSVKWWDGENPWAFVWSLNAERRDLDDGQRAYIRLDIVAGERRWLEECATRKAGRPLLDNSGNVAGINRKRKSIVERPQRETRAALAREAKVSPRTAQKAITVRKAVAQGALTVDVDGAIKAGKTTLNQAYRQVTRAKAAAKISAEPQPLPTGPFRVLVADPPWAYEKRKDDGTHRAALTYPDMTTDEICNLTDVDGVTVGSIAADDAILWLWTTNAFMRDAFRVIDAWGFKEKTILTWVKNKMGTGDWLRGQTEHCILAVRGRPVVVLTNQTTVINGAVREHSRKPDEFYALVDALCPGSKVELFAREPRDGYAAWGAETAKF